MSGDTTKYKKAIFASGCFWGTEYYMQKAKGVVSTEVGFIGGTKDNPTYKEVCTGKTGHAEACLVVYNPDETNYEELTKLFFETHDPTQVNRQGPDIGTQYRTEIFYLDDEQKATAEKLIKILKKYFQALQYLKYLLFQNDNCQHFQYLADFQDCLHTSRRPG